MYLNVFSGANLGLMASVVLVIISMIIILPMTLIEAPKCFKSFVGKAFVVETKITDKNDKEVTHVKPNRLGLIIMIVVILGLTYHNLRQDINTPESLQNLNTLICTLEKKNPDKNISIQYFNDLHVFVELTPKVDHLQLRTKTLVLEFDELFTSNTCENH